VLDWGVILSLICWLPSHIDISQGENVLHVIFDQMDDMLLPGEAWFALL